MSVGGNSDNLGVRAQYSTVEKATHPDALRLLAFWDARPVDGLVMGRDLPSRAVANLLSNISILEPTAERTDLRVRVTGASLFKRWGGDTKGRLLSELFSPDEMRDHLKSCLAAIDTGLPVIVDSSLVAFGTVPKLNLEVVLLPIFAPDRSAAWVLSGMFYFG
jgi:hypothetical protein